jgi:polysaccharide biosynthesis protein PslG
MMGKLRAWSAALAIATVGLGVAASPAAAVPKTFWGVVPQATPTTEQFLRLQRGRVGSIRIPVPWSAIQPVQGGVPEWQGVDALVRGAAIAGIDVLPFVSSAPSWAVAVDRSIASQPPVTLPVKTGAQRAAWTSFLTMAVERYGPGGTFWSENPTVPVRPIRAWQIWNEENFLYFVARPNPADYGKLVKLSDTAIHAVDPGAKVVLGGMFAYPKEARSRAKPAKAYFATDFLERMYKRTPGVKSRFDAVALHPYTSDFHLLAPQIEEVRKTLSESKDPTKAIWITELGWSSKPPSSTNSFAKGPSGQAKQLKGAFGLLRKRAAKWRIERVYWFSIDDQRGVCNFCDGSGLFGPGFTPKPAWNAFVGFTGGQAG